MLAITMDPNLSNVSEFDRILKVFVNMNELELSARISTQGNYSER